MRPILLLEINEVPWRVVDLALAQPRLAATREFFARAQTYTTVSDDEGELSPWITWPSLHRGMRNTEHAIKNLGQDVSTFRGTPIWEEYRQRGLSIGICGSMQSWPPIDPGEGGFYIPDTFAHDARTIPCDLESLQKLNLDLVSKNGLVSRRLELFSRQTLRALPLFARRISRKTVARIAAQLFAERLTPSRKARRAIFQTLLFWDVFQSLYRPKTAPALATFFTNHVAGVMHRFWNHVFPADFTESNTGEHVETMRFALQVMDDIVARALQWQAQRPDLIVVFATSMGQAAVHREKVGYVASITDLKSLMQCFGVTPDHYEPLLAMVPQVALRVPEPRIRERLCAALAGARTKSGLPLFQVDEVSASLSITIITPLGDDATAGGFSRADATWMTWKQSGITLDDFADGTGYHVPEGVLAIVGEGITASNARTVVPLTRVKSMLLSLGEITSPARKTS